MNCACGGSNICVYHAREMEREAVGMVAAPKQEPAPDLVNHPPHYKRGGIETLDFIEAKGLGYHLGNVVKYVSRAGHKEGVDPVDDLKKARFYLDREIERRAKG